MDRHDCWGDAFEAAIVKEQLVEEAQMNVGYQRARQACQGGNVKRYQSLGEAGSSTSPFYKRGIISCLV